jgi:hypothetical protein
MRLDHQAPEKEFLFSTRLAAFLEFVVKSTWVNGKTEFDGTGMSISTLKSSMTRFVAPPTRNTGAQLNGTTEEELTASRSIPRTWGFEYRTDH